jgi:hypothetical protein
MNKPDIMMIDDVKYIREDSARVSHIVHMSSEVGPWMVGANYLIRTVTMIDTGRLVAIGPLELVLEDAAWIADTGRFSDAIEKAEFSEVEPFPKGRVIINRSCVIDAVEISKIPRSKK